jgi:hypothetical protein
MNSEAINAKTQSVIAKTPFQQAGALFSGETVPIGALPSFIFMAGMVTNELARD